MTQLTDTEWQQLIQAALEVQQRAYAPYSHFTVGAAILDASGKRFTGANVENASYGLTICAGTRRGLRGSDSQGSAEHASARPGRCQSRRRPALRGMPAVFDGVRCGHAESRSSTVRPARLNIWGRCDYCYLQRLNLNQPAPDPGAIAIGCWQRGEVLGS